MSIDKLCFIVKFSLHSIRQYLRFKAISVLDSKLYQSNKNWSVWNQYLQKMLTNIR